VVANGQLIAAVVIYVYKANK